MLSMKRILLWLFVICAAVIGGPIVYRFIQIGYTVLQIRYFPNESQKKMIAVLPKFKSIMIHNDLHETIFAECTRDGNVVTENYDEGGTIMDTQGKVRIFVPKKGGWFIIEYPYPYPLTEQTSWIVYGPNQIMVALSNLIDSVKTGEVETSNWSTDEKNIVKDIKVTFQPGEGPKEASKK